MPIRTVKPNITKADAIAELRALLPVGSTVYIVLRNVSASGMTRRMSFFYLKDGELLSLTYRMAAALGYPLKDDGNWSLQVQGCGMDMGFHVVHSLAYVLHPDAPHDDSVPADQRRGYTLTHRWI